MSDAVRRRPAGPGAARLPPGHVRTPALPARPARAWSSASPGHFANPEELAYGRDGLPRAGALPGALRQTELWPDYAGAAARQRWSPTSTSTGWSRRRRPSACTTHHRTTIARHPHPHQPDLEDQPFDHYQLMAEAVGELLIEKGVFSADDLRRTIEAIDARSPADGARLVARAWRRSGLQGARCWRTSTPPRRELGIDAGRDPDPGAREHPRRCTTSSSARSAPAIRAACSACRPTGTRRAPTARARCASRARCWPSSAPRSRTRSRSGSTTAPPICATWCCRCGPPGSEGLGEAELAALVTRDCMIGTALPNRRRAER